MSLSRPVFVVAVALLAAVPSTAAAQSSASLKLSSAGKRALKPAKLTLTSSKLTVSRTTVASSATLTLGGSLRFSSGKRSVSATGLKVTIGRTSSYVSARVAKKQLRLLTVTPTRPASLDAARGAVTLTGARVALTPAGAKALRKALKLKRTPSTKTLGKLSVAVPPAPAPAPTAPAPTVPPGPNVTVSPQPTTTPTPTPAPAPLCAERFAATPAGSVDWFACDLPGMGDLKSWTNYLSTPWGALPGCPPLQGSITASGDASRISGDSALDHRFKITGETVGGDGSTIITASGTVSYQMPAHGIDESVGPLRIVIAPDGLTGTVYADGTAKTFDNTGGACSAAPTPFTNEPVMTLDLSGITPVTAGGVKRWVHVPARIAPGNTRFGGGVYLTGTPWGAFTIAVAA